MRPLRTLLSSLFVVLGLLLAAVAAPATWAKETLLDTPTWTEAITPLIAEPAMQRTVSDALVSALDPDAEMPAFARELVVRATDAAVATDSFARAWGSAVKISHEHLVETVRDEGKGIDVSEGVVAVDLAPLFEALVPRLAGAGVPGTDLIPTPEGQIVLEDSADLARILEATGEVDAYAWPLAALAAVLLVVGALAARNRGRSLMVIGTGLVLVAALELGAWRLLETALATNGGAASGQLVIEALTGSVEEWLLWLGVAGVVVLALGVLVLGVAAVRRPQAQVDGGES